MSKSSRTQVGIIGAGPAGLLLGHLLHRQGIESVILEGRSRAYVEERVRAGILEQGTVNILDESGVGERMAREGLPHDGIELRFDGRAHRIDMHALTGRRVMVYGQTEVVKDLIAARLKQGAPIVFEATADGVADIETSEPKIHYKTKDGEQHELVCDVIAGCDGFHGVSRAAVPDRLTRTYERTYPFAWLGILAETPPPSEELIYSHHERGFALFSMRSSDVSRHYIQCDPDGDAENWSDEQIWDELETRGWFGKGALPRGKVLQKGVTPMRSFVTDPMRHGRLFLTGDAGHIVPPTGAKGLNLAVADVRILAEALAALFTSGDESLIDDYSERALRRVWRAQHFSWLMTSMLHRFHGENDFDMKLQVSQLDYITRSKAAETSIAENYTGIPFDEI